MADLKGLSYQSEVSWEDVFALWQEHEGTREDWQQVAKEKGWPSWAEWRDAWVGNFDAQNRKWKRYVIDHPLEMVPTFRVGPTQAWQRNFPEEESNQHTFAYLVERVSYEQNKKVRALLENFPSPSEFIGILMPDKSITAIEGHHRATALALAVQQGRDMIFQQLPTIVLTEFRSGEEELLGKMLQRGSHNHKYLWNQ